MAFANSQVSDLIATTIDSRTKDPTDNLSTNNALIRRLKTKGNIKPVSGGNTIFQEIFYDDPATASAGSYSGYDTLNTTPDSPISAAQYLLKHYASPVTIAGTEILANSGKEQMADLLGTRVEIAEARLMNKIDLDLHGDGTGNGGKNIVGLSAMISTTPTTGTYGNIDRATWTFWRNISTTSTIVNGGAATAATIQNLINTVALQLVRGSDYADLIYMGQTAYALYLASLQAYQKVESQGNDMAGAGFTALKYYGAGNSADVILGGGIGGNQTATRMDFINSSHVFFRPHSKRNFTNIGGDRQPVNQDAVIRFIGWSGALTCDYSRANAVALTS